MQEKASDGGFWLFGVFLGLFGDLKFKEKLTLFGAFFRAFSELIQFLRALGIYWTTCWWPILSQFVVKGSISGYFL
jgi:hypothetical protein